MPSVSIRKYGWREIKDKNGHRFEGFTAYCPVSRLRRNPNLALRDQTDIQQSQQSGLLPGLCRRICIWHLFGNVD